MKGEVCLFPKGELSTGSWPLDLAMRLAFSRYLTIEHKASLPPPKRSTRRHLGGLIPGLGLWWYRERLTSALRGLWPHRVVCVSNAVEQRQFMIFGQEVIAIALHHAGIKFGIHARQHGLHGFIQAQANHVRCGIFPRHRQTQVARGRLDALDDG